MKIVVSTVWLLTLSLWDSYFLLKTQLKCIWPASGYGLQQCFPHHNDSVLITHHLQATVICKRALKFSASGAWFHFLFNFLAEQRHALLCSCAVCAASRPEKLQKWKKGAICVIDADWSLVPLGFFMMASQKKDLLYRAENWRSHCVFSSVQQLRLWTTRQMVLDRKALRAELGNPAPWPPQKGSFVFTYGVSGNEKERFLSYASWDFWILI